MRADEPGLLTDVYELTMAQAYLEHDMSAEATFSLFVRNYPPNRSYLVAAGLEDVLRFLEGFGYPKESIDYLRSTGIFSSNFLDYLSQLRFTGSVWAIPEGRLFFAEEPVVEVTAPIVEAQLVETYIINQINLQSLIATKAARCFWAARGRSLVDFSFRRTHGVEAGTRVARASHIAGFDATSNVFGGRLYGLPLSGTIGHSFVSSHEHEVDAFRAFSSSFPERSILLIDTYDTLAGAEKAVQVGKEMEARGQRLRGVRLDSGDLGELSRQVREILDRAGLDYVQIVASGGLDEYQIDELTHRRVPIDTFGVGTALGVSADAPWSDMAYKLVKYDGRAVMKLSTGKISLPDEKQVFRLRDRHDMFTDDIIALRSDGPEGLGLPEERQEAAEPLLTKVMEEGRILEPLPPPAELRARFKNEFASLDDKFKVLTEPPLYDVSLSPSLKTLHQKMERELLAGEVALTVEEYE